MDARISFEVIWWAPVANQLENRHRRSFGGSDRWGLDGPRLVPQTCQSRVPLDRSSHVEPSQAILIRPHPPAPSPPHPTRFNQIVVGSAPQRAIGLGQDVSTRRRFNQCLLTQEFTPAPQNPSGPIWRNGEPPPDLTCKVSVSVFQSKGPGMKVNSGEFDGVAV